MTTVSQGIPGVINDSYKHPRVEAIQNQEINPDYRSKFISATTAKEHQDKRSKSTIMVAIVKSTYETPFAVIDQ